MFVSQSLQLLKDNNQKVTKTRLRILGQLEHIKKPLNPYELLEQSSDKEIDISTIYRNLELFE
jgi:Fe2+ or Zn2+ uptake regulation protein